MRYATDPKPRLQYVIKDGVLVMKWVKPVAITFTQRG